MFRIPWKHFYKVEKKQTFGLIVVLPTKIYIFE